MQFTVDILQDFSIICLGISNILLGLRLNRRGI